MSDQGEQSTLPSLAATAFRDRGHPLMLSFRMRRARSGFCHAGWCQQCRVTLDDGTVTLACQTPDNGTTTVRPMATTARWLGRIAERLSPWFYEHRFLRPRFLRQFYLERLRTMSAAPHLPSVAVRPGRVHEDADCDVLIVGGGLAGLAAAASAAREGLSTLVVEAARFGGRALWQADGKERIGRALGAARDAGAMCREGVPCAGLYEHPWRALCVTSEGTLRVRFARLVVATGAYDRLPSFPGNDLPGVIGTRAFERLAAQGMVPARAEIGVYGHPAEIGSTLIAAQRARLPISWIASPQPYEHETIAVYRRTTPQRVHGRRYLSSVTLASAGRVRCDVLVMALSQPTYELQTQIGLSPQLAGVPPSLHFDAIATDILLCVGDAAGDVSDQSDHRPLADRVAETTSAWITGQRPVAQPVQDERDGFVSPSPATDDAIVCLCEDVKALHLRRAIAEGYSDVELLKRHTGVGTGPCQGKLCHAEMLHCLQDAGFEARLPTMRPLVRPVVLGTFAGEP